MGAVEEIHDRERRAALAVGVLVVRHLREHRRGRDHDWREVDGPDPVEAEWGKVRTGLVVRYGDYDVPMTIEVRIGP